MTAEVQFMDERGLVELLGDIKHRIFPRPFERLAVTGHGLVGVEIGVYRAAHALSMLKHLDIARLYLIDPYDMYDEYVEAKGYYGAERDSLQDARRFAMDRLAAYGDRVVWLPKLSADAVQDVPDDLDFVYVDGNHEERFVRQDIELYFPRVRRGGVIGGHDFYNGFRREHDGVVRAVCEFAVANGLDLQVELPDWWVAK